MKKMFLLLTLVLGIGLWVNPVFSRDIGSIVIKKGIVQGNDVIKVKVFQDPQMPFISIFLTTIKSGKLFAMADPSNNSVATRITRMPTKKEKLITATNASVVNLRKSIGQKTIKICRFYDAVNKTLIYVTYSTKILDGSYKHSMSVVPIGKILMK